MKEIEIKHNINIDISMYNDNGDFVLSAYQRMIINMIENHLDVLNIGEKDLMDKYGISWVLLSTSIELKRPLHPNDKLIGITWHAGGRLPSFRRDFVFSDLSGEIVATGSTVSVWFDNLTRKLCLDRAKLSVINLQPHPPIQDAIVRKISVPDDALLIENRKVRPSMTDGIGHVNNTKYGDYVYDAMSPLERYRLGKLKRIDTLFNYELREGDIFGVYKSSDNENDVCYHGIRLNDTKSAFDMKLTFFDSDTTNYLCK